jgi:EAL domain-containing protein (putative c-di-GMP-specific phosphodiesterase class I)
MTQGSEACGDGQENDLAFSMAFQPIVDAARGRVWGYEALVRGPDGAPAASVLSEVDAESRQAFDQACRVRAIEMAAALFPPGDELKLAINVMANAIDEPVASLGASIAVAERAGLARDSIVFEFTEREQVAAAGHLQRIVDEYRRQGFLTAIDDFGSGHAGLSRLAEFQPDIVKLDMALVRGIEASRARQVIVAGFAWTARTLGVALLAEGVETEKEFLILRAAGIGLFQGYYFAKPGFETLPEVDLGNLPARTKKSA